MLGMKSSSSGYIMLEVNASGTCITVTAYDYVTAQHMIAAMTM